MTSVGKPLPQLSASQLKKTPAYDAEPGCWRRWFYNYVEGRREPGGPAAQRGKAYHAEMEAWSIHGTFPASPPTIKSLKYAPPTGVANTEDAILIPTGGGWSWRGFIDLLYGWDGRLTDKGLDGSPVPFGEGAFTVVHDWKYSGSLRNAKDAAYLQKDAAAVLYAEHAYAHVPGLPVVGRWVYVEMNDKTANREVLFDMPKSVTEPRLAELNVMGDEIQAQYAAAENGATAVDMPRNTSHCYAFRQDCPFMAECKPTFRITLGKGLNMPNFKEAMDTLDDMPPPPVDAPPPPADDPPPPPVDDAPPPPPAESGFINAPEADAEPADSPETLAARQGVGADDPTAATEAYLSTLDHDALRDLAVSLDLVKASTKAQPKALTSKIVNSGWRYTADGEPETPPPEPEVEVKTVPVEDVAKAFADARQPELPFEALHDIVETPEATSKGFTLYVNCAPVSGGATPSAEVVRMANLKISEAHGVPDWRFVQYVGAAELNQTVAALLEDGPLSGIDALVIDTRTPEGAVLLDTLTMFADEVVRGF